MTIEDFITQTIKEIQSELDGSEIILPHIASGKNFKSAMGGWGIRTKNDNGKWAAVQIELDLSNIFFFPDAYEVTEGNVKSVGDEKINANRQQLEVWDVAEDKSCLKTKIYEVIELAKSLELAEAHARNISGE